MSVLERKIYVLERDVHIREMPVLGRCLYWRDACIREMPVLDIPVL